MQRDPFRFNGTVIDGQFRIDQWIGEGGFSNVYKGFHLGLNEPIAVKCLKPIADSPEVVQDFVNRFRDESRIAYRLSQGNLDIVRCIASGTTIAPIGVRVPYMVLEWLEGESLANHFRTRRDAKAKGRTLKEAFDMFSPAGEALVYAHSHGIIHRDIKPGNLFLTKTRQGATRLKVLDFGMAKVLSDGSSESTGFSRLAMSMANIAIFSPPYAAPEQFDPTLGPISARVDVYSFALVFLEALLDRRVRTGETDAECLIQACKPAVPITPRGLGLTVPDTVERILAQACSTNPRERPQSMEEFWGKLRNAMQGNANSNDDPQDWGDVADSIPPDADGPATIVADTEGLFDDEPAGPPLPPIPAHPPVPSHVSPAHGSPSHGSSVSPVSLPRAPQAVGDEESTRTIDVQNFPQQPGQAPQQAIPPEVKDFLQRTGLAASARMPGGRASDAGPAPHASGPSGAGPSGAKPFARSSQPGGFHLPRPTIPRPEGAAAALPAAGSASGGRIPAPLPAAGTPAEGVSSRGDGANGRPGAGGRAARPSGTAAMAAQSPQVPYLEEDNGPSSSDMPTTVGSLNELPGAGGGAPRYDLASAQTEVAPEGPAPFGATSPEPFFANQFGGAAPVRGAPAGAGANAKGKTLALPAGFAQQFSNTPPADPDAEAPTQAQYAPQHQDGMAYQPPAPYAPHYPPSTGASPFASAGPSQQNPFGAPDGSQQGAAPFGPFGSPPAASPFGGQYGPPPGVGAPGSMSQPPPPHPHQGPGGPAGWHQQQPGAPQGFAAGQGFPQQPPVAGAAPYGAQPQKPKLVLIGLVAALAVILLIGAGYAAYSLLHSYGADTSADPNAKPPAAGAEGTNPPSTPDPAADPAKGGALAQPTPTGAQVAPAPPPAPEPPPPPPVQAPAPTPTPPAPAPESHAAAADTSRHGSTGGGSTGSTASGSDHGTDRPSSGSSGSTSATAKSSAPNTGSSQGGPTQISRPPGGDSGKFSPEAARASLKTMESVLASCKKPDGPTGTGRARVTFIGDGSVMSSVIVGPPYEGTPVGDCVATRFKFAKVPKFEGNPGVVDYSFNINK